MHLGTTGLCAIVRALTSRLSGLTLALTLGLSACGGGGGSPPPPPASVTQTISAASGGTIAGPDGLTLTIPPGALAADTTITLVASDSGGPALPAGISASGPTFALLPHGTRFGVPVTLSLPVRAGASLLKTNAAGDGWEQLDVIEANGIASAAITGFSRGVWAATAPPQQQPPPQIIGEPSDSFVLSEGGFWIFHVDVAGRAPFAYAWMRNGGQVPNETNRDILINPVRLADDGALYSVRVTDAEGRSTTSRSARLTVTATAPRIVNPPVDVQVVEGRTAVFGAASTSSIAQTLRWKSCPAGGVCPADVSLWLDEPNGGSTALAVTAVPLAAHGTRYAFCASNAAGTTCSASVTLTVLAAPVQPLIVTPPQPLSAGAGTSASFTVVASGGTLSYAWQSGRDGVTFTAEPRCTDSATCTFSNVALGDDGLLLRVRVSNSAGQAVSDPAARLTVRLVTGVALARVSGGLQTSVGLRGDGRLVEWGARGGVPSTAPPFVHGTPLDVATLAAGNTHTLAIRANGEVVAWGTNTNGQLGDGNTGASRTSALPVSGLSASSSVAAGIGAPRGAADDDSRFSIAVSATNGLVWAWGANLSGQLGNGNTQQQLLPVPVGRISGVTGVAAGRGHVLARRSDGSVWAWGRNTSGQLGTGDRSASLRPLPIALADIVAVAAGEEFSVALKSDGTVLTWGNPGNGRLGDGGTGARNSPAAIMLPAPAIGIAVGVNHALALLLDGRVYAWGANEQGQVGSGSLATSVATPQRVVAPLPANIVAIGAGGFHSLALDADGRVWAWGANSSGQLADGTRLDRLTPVQATGVALN